MKVLSVISQKGGGGRTTTSIHLSVEAERRGQEVALLDIDPQASSAGWADHRTVDYPSVTSVQPSRMQKAIDQARACGATLVVIDTAPHSADAAVAAAECSDLVLIPCRIGVLDLRAIATTVKIAKLAGRRAVVVFNHAPHRAPKLIAEASDVVRDYGVEIAPVVIHQRASFGHALTSGLAAQEYDPTSKAAEEVAALYAWVSAELGLAS